MAADVIQIARELIDEGDKREIGTVSLKPWPEPISYDAFYGLAGELVSAISPYSEADDNSLLISFLAMAGNLLHRVYYFPVGADHHHANLYAVIVGNSSKGRKGMSANFIKRIFMDADPAWTDGITSGMSSGEGIIYKVRNPVMQKQPVKDKGRVVEYQDVMIDKGVADKRLFILEAEFGQALRVMARQGNTLSPVIRQAWDSGNLNTIIKNNSNQATDAHVSILGHITQFELIDLLQQTEAYNGFGNRFLWILSKRSKLLPEGAEIPAQVLSQLSSRIRRVIDFTEVNEAIQELKGYADVEGIIPPIRSKKMQRDPGAREYWNRLYIELSSERPGLFGAMTARAEAHLLRLSMIYALLDCSEVVRVEHIKAAQAVVEYADRCAKYIFDDRGPSKNAQEILIFLETAGGEATQTDISSKVFNRNVAAVDIKNALTELLKAGLVKKLETANGSGRPKTIWKLLNENNEKTK